MSKTLLSMVLMLLLMNGIVIRRLLFATYLAGFLPLARLGPLDQRLRLPPINGASGTRRKPREISDILARGVDHLEYDMRRFGVQVQDHQIQHCA